MFPCFDLPYLSPPTPPIEICRYVLYPVVVADAAVASVMLPYYTPSDDMEHNFVWRRQPETGIHVALVIHNNPSDKKNRQPLSRCTHFQKSGSIGSCLFLYITAHGRCSGILPNTWLERISISIIIPISLFVSSIFFFGLNKKGKERQTGKIVIIDVHASSLAKCSCLFLVNVNLAFTFALSHNDCFNSDPIISCQDKLLIWTHSMLPSIQH